MRRLPTTDGAIVLDAEAFAPAAVDAVEFQQMRGRRGAALELVDMHDVEPVVRARIVGRAIDAAHRGAQREAADPAHAVDADAHGQLTTAAAGKPPPPISSSRAFIAMRSSEAKGRAVKISIRRRRLAYSSFSSDRALDGTAGELGRIGQRPGAGHRQVAEIGADLPVQRVAERDDEIHARRIAAR